MQQIIFKTHYLYAIRAGTKTQTTRCWKRKYNLKPGDHVIATDYRRKIPLEISYIKLKNFEELDQDDARVDGFSSIADYRNALIGLYNLPSEVLLIGFKLSN